MKKLLIALVLLCLGNAQAGECRLGIVNGKIVRIKVKPCNTVLVQISKKKTVRAYVPPPTRVAYVHNRRKIIPPRKPVFVYHPKPRTVTIQRRPPVISYDDHVVIPVVQTRLKSVVVRRRVVVVQTNVVVPRYVRVYRTSPPRRYRARYTRSRNRRYSYPHRRRRNWNMRGWNTDHGYVGPTFTVRF